MLWSYIHAGLNSKMHFCISGGICGLMYSAISTLVCTGNLTSLPTLNVGMRTNTGYASNPWGLTRVTLLWIQHWNAGCSLHRKWVWYFEGWHCSTGRDFCQGMQVKPSVWTNTLEVKFVLKVWNKQNMPVTLRWWRNSRFKVAEIAMRVYVCGFPLTLKAVLKCWSTSVLKGLHNKTSTYDNNIYMHYQHWELWELTFIYLLWQNWRDVADCSEGCDREGCGSIQIYAMGFPMGYTSIAHLIKSPFPANRNLRSIGAPARKGGCWGVGGRGTNSSPDLAIFISYFCFSEQWLW